MIGKIMKRNLKSLFNRFVSLIVVKRRGGGGEMLCLHRPKRAQLIQMSSCRGSS